MEVYIRRVKPDVADDELAAIEKTGLDKIVFAWLGGIQKGDPHYYRVQAGRFVLEYDNTQNNANHVHCIWRDFANDFGGDLLKRHASEAHGK
jgi:hypothetical protein